MEDVLKVYDQLAYLVGTLIRPLGAAVFGAVIGWLVTTTFQDAVKEWQLKIAMFLGLLGTFIAMFVYAGPGTTAFFSLGAGVTVAVLAMRSNQASKKK
jgi:hypothetical protein